MIILSSVCSLFLLYLSLTHYCSYPWLWLLRPDDQMDTPHHQISNYNCPNFCFCILQALLEFLNGLLWVRDFQERFLGVCVHAHISIIETKKIKSQFSFIPLEPSSNS